VKKVLVLGAGSFALEATDVVEALGWQVAGYVVDVKDAPKTLKWKPVYHVDNDMPFLPCVCGIVSPERMGLVNRLVERGFRFQSAVHPSASVDDDDWWFSSYSGALVNRGAAISRATKVGLCVVINRGATVGHDCSLYACCTIGPGANLAGGVIVGERAVVGMGANVREGVTVGAGAVVGMGAVVLRDVPPGETWWGVPARRIK